MDYPATAWSTAQIGKPTGLKPYFYNSFPLVVRPAWTLIGALNGYILTHSAFAAPTRGRAAMLFLVSVRFRSC